MGSSRTISHGSCQEGNGKHSSILAWRIPWTEEPGGPWWVYGVAKSWTRLSKIKARMGSSRTISHG